MIALQAATMYLLTFFGDFLTDDFLDYGLARTEPFGWKYISTTNFGHFHPAFRVVYFVLQHVLPFHYDVARLVMLAFDVAAMVVFWRLLVLVIGPRRLALVFLALLGFSMTLLANNAWIAASIDALPTLLFVILVIDGHLRWMLHHRIVHLVQAGISMVLALTFYEKPLLLLVYLPLLVVLLFTRTLRPGAIGRTLLRAWPLWVLDAVVVLPYAWYSVRHPYTVAGPPHGIGPYVDVAARGWFFGLLPGALGGPWQWIDRPGYLVMEPTLLVAVVDQVLVAAVLLVTVFRRRSALRWWLFVAVFHVGTAILITRYRYTLYGPGIAHDVRYLFDDAMLLYLAVALAVVGPRIGALAGEPARPLPHSLRMPRLQRAARMPLALLMGTAVTAAFVVPAVHFAQRWHEDSSATWLSALRDDLARTPAPHVLFDDDVPENIVPGSYAPYSHVSNVVGLVEGGAVFDRLHPAMLAITTGGHVVPAELVVDAQGLPSTASPVCRTGPASVEVALDARVPIGVHHLVMHYTAQGAVLVVGVSDGPGGETVTNVWYPYVLDGDGTLVARLGPHPASRLVLTFAAGSVCFDHVRVGHDVAAR